MALTHAYKLPVMRGSTLDKSFWDLFRREDLQDSFDVSDWMHTHGVKYESAITYDYYTFTNYDAWVQFQLAWLLGT
jgi:hypothetical protein